MPHAIRAFAWSPRRAGLHATRALVLLAAAGLSAQAPAPAGLDTVLKQAEAQRAAYVATFRNVTATETRVTELFDEQGRVDKRREVTILDYREKTPRRVDPRSMGSPFADPRVVSNGRVWLDASDHRLRRLVTEGVVSDKTLAKPGVAGRLTNTDSDFKRFDVSTVSDIRLPAGKEP